jgi:hypothetical protein
VITTFLPSSLPIFASNPHCQLYSSAAPCS